MGKYPRVMMGQSASGFTYPIVLVLIATTAVMAGVTEQYVSHMLQREKEAELLFRGEQYVLAIQSYYEARGYLPNNVDDLLSDPRFLNKRHIRRLYSDPMVEEGVEWELIRDQNGAVMGVASSSQKEAIKKSHFPMRFAHLEGAETYSEWKFVFDPGKFNSKNARGALDRPRDEKNVSHVLP